MLPSAKLAGSHPQARLATRASSGPGGWVKGEQGLTRGQPKQKREKEGKEEANKEGNASPTQPPGLTTPRPRSSP